MIDREREESEARRRLIAAQSRAANPPRPVRVIPPSDRAADLAALLGQTLSDESGPINWAALTRA